jgi:hypothetical protein
MAAGVQESEVSAKAAEVANLQRTVNEMRNQVSKVDCFNTAVT